MCLEHGIFQDWGFVSMDPILPARRRGPRQLQCLSLGDLDILLPLLLPAELERLSLSADLVRLFSGVDMERLFYWFWFC